MAGRQRRTERLAHRPRGRFVYDLHHATAQMNVITKIRAAIVSEAAIISTILVESIGHVAGHHVAYQGRCARGLQLDREHLARCDARGHCHLDLGRLRG